jgi:hypothetical protein
LEIRSIGLCSAVRICSIIDRQSIPLLNPLTLLVGAIYKFLDDFSRVY